MELDGLFQRRRFSFCHLTSVCRPYRVLYAFDPRSVAVLLVGGDKTGNDRWYEERVPHADQVYKAHLDALEMEG